MPVLIQFSDAGAITDALEPLLTGSQFAGAPRGSRFLRYVVEAIFAGMPIA